MSETIDNTNSQANQDNTNYFTKVKDEFKVAHFNKEHLIGYPLRGVEPIERILASTIRDTNLLWAPPRSICATIVILLMLIVSAGSVAAQTKNRDNPTPIIANEIAPTSSHPNDGKLFNIFLARPSSTSSASAIVSQQKIYEFRCRGARTEKEMSIAIEDGSREGYNKLVIGFKFGTRPAPQGLDPGQCSWIDRAMRAGEPVRLEEDVPQDAKSAADYLRSASNYWTFYVTNTGKGYFRVTKSHFGTPANL